MSNLSNAHSIIILADDAGNSISTAAENDRLVLTAKKLSASSKKPIPIIVEILDTQSADLAQSVGMLDDGQIEIVSTQRLGQNLLAQVAVTPGLTKIYEDLIRLLDTKQMRFTAVPFPRASLGSGLMTCSSHCSSCDKRVSK